MNSSQTDQLSAAIRGSRGGGGGPRQSDKKKTPTALFVCFFLVLGLFYRSQMVNFKEKYHFSRFRRGSKFSRGGGAIAYSL